MAEPNKKPRAERTKNIPRQSADWLGMTPCEACPATVLFRPHALGSVMRRRVKNMAAETRTPIRFRAISFDVEDATEYGLQQFDSDGNARAG